MPITIDGLEALSPPLGSRVVFASFEDGLRDTSVEREAGTEGAP